MYIKKNKHINPAYKNIKLVLQDGQYDKMYKAQFTKVYTHSAGMQLFKHMIKYYTRLANKINSNALMHMHSIYSSDVQNGMPPITYYKQHKIKNVHLHTYLKVMLKLTTLMQQYEEAMYTYNTLYSLIKNIQYYNKAHSLLSSMRVLEGKHLTHSILKLNKAQAQLYASMCKSNSSSNKLPPYNAVILAVDKQQ